MKLLTSLLLLYVLSLSCSAKQRALLVGIDNYKNPKDRLKGCLNDVALMKKLLINKFGFAEEDILILKDSQATTKGIVKKFKEHLVKGISKDDSVVFYYSGHGSLAPDFNGDESDGKDELICSYDLNPRDTSTWFTDDRMEHLIKQLPTQKAWIVLDCCHSGTANRSLRKLPAGAKSRFMEIGFDEHSDSQLKRSLGKSWNKAKQRSQNMHNPLGKHTFFSACQANQTAIECSIDGVRNGVMTNSIVSVLNRNPNLSITEVQKLVDKRVIAITKRLKAKQNPYFATSTSSIPLTKLLDGFSKDLIPYQAPAVNLPAFQNYQKHGSIKVSLSLAKQRYKVGENLRLQVTASEDCYVRLYHYGVDNTVTQIYPNAFAKNNKLAKGKPLLFPAKGASFQFTLNPPLGNEIIKAVVSKKQFTDIAAAGVNGGFTTYQDSNLKISSDRGVPDKKGGYGENIIIYSISEK